MTTQMLALLLLAQVTEVATSVKGSDRGAHCLKSDDGNVLSDERFARDGAACPPQPDAPSSGRAQRKTIRAATKQREVEDRAPEMASEPTEYARNRPRREGGGAQ